MTRCPESVASRSLGASELGRQNITSFISTRIQNNQTNFWDTVKKLNISTFSGVARKVTVESQKGKVVYINDDRKLFGRLLVVAKKREVNLKEVLSFEFCCAASPLLLCILMVAYGRRRKVPS